MAFQQAMKTMSSTSKNTESSAPEGGSNTEVVAWEGLGEAYFRDGWCNTAQRALQRALELVEPKAEPNSPSPLAVSIHWLLGRVFQNLSEFPEALAHFDSALRLLHQSQAPTDGFVSTVGSIMDCIMVAYPNLLSANCAEHNLATLYRSWRGAAVSETLVLSSALSSLTPSPLDSTHRAAALAALACLSLRVQLRTLTPLAEFATPTANLYFQPATLYYDHFRETTTTTTTTTTNPANEEAATASSIAEQAWLVNALQANKATFQPEYWNHLGVVASSTSSSLSTAEADPHLAQHAFIRAVTIQPKNVSAWSNLGFLYLQHGKLELANRVFTQIQNLDPEFVPVWAGQALLADQLGQPTEALALY
ncbi:Superkiller protein 3, partial [Dimargaris cristalligena]